jgi:predicted solute-binding protein
MLQKADAALIVNLVPQKEIPPEHYTLDLVEEWSDMTGFPYVHGFWVAREEDVEPDHIKALMEAKNRGVAAIETIAGEYSTRSNLPQQEVKTYFGSFSYDLGQNEIDSITEFITLAYYHGVLGDVPEITFFDSPAST